MSAAAIDVAHIEAGTRVGHHHGCGGAIVLSDPAAWLMDATAIPEGANAHCRACQAVFMVQLKAVITPIVYEAAPA